MDLAIRRYIVRLTAAAVVDANGNPVTRNYVRALGALPGGFDGTGWVNALDVAGIRKLFPTNSNRFADMNGDGIVTPADMDVAAANLGKHI